MLRAYLINIKIIEILNIKISSYFFSLHRRKRKPFIAKYIHNKRLEKKKTVKTLQGLFWSVRCYGNYRSIALFGAIIFAKFPKDISSNKKILHTSI